MGYYDVWEVFVKHPDTWLTKQDIKKYVGLGEQSINNSLRSLRKSKIIYRRIIYVGDVKTRANMVRKYKLVPKDKTVVLVPYFKDLLVPKKQSN